MKLKRFTPPSELRDLESRLNKLGKEKNIYVKLHDLDKATAVRSEEERVRKILDQEQKRKSRDQERKQQDLQQEQERKMRQQEQEKKT